MSGDGDRRSNIELKARCPDRAHVREALRSLGAEDCGVEQQIDTYFSTGAYRMKLRESSSGNHTLIWYSRPNTTGSRKSTYRLQSIPDPRTKRRILSQAMGIKQVVTKDRHLFQIGPTRIHLDSVARLVRIHAPRSPRRGERAAKPVPRSQRGKCRTGQS